MGNVTEKDKKCDREGWGMWQRRMGNVAEKNGEFGREGYAECSREGWGLAEKDMRNVAEKDGDVAEKDWECGREGYGMWQRRMGDAAEWGIIRGEIGYVCKRAPKARISAGGDRPQHVCEFGVRGRRGGGGG